MIEPATHQTEDRHHSVWTNMRRNRGKRQGTPTGPPEPQAIDPASGFKVPLANLARQWDGQMIDTRFIDIRNPQDYVRGIKDDQSLPFARPETPNEFIAAPLLWEDGSFMYVEGSSGQLIMSQGVDPADTL